LKVLRIYPPPGREVSDIYEDLDLPLAGHHGASRPYVILNMVSSVDGRTAIGGKAAGMGSPTDRRTMRTLRSKADAVMIGAGTLRAERVSLGLDPSDDVPQPLAIIVTDSGDVPLEEHLIVPEGQEVLTLLSDVAPRKVVERLGKLALVMRVPADPTGAVDLDGALRVLRAERGVESIVVEGGPSLNHALISHNLVDELFLTVAPELLGGSADQTLTLLKGPELTIRPTLELLSSYSAESELFLRYSLSHTPPNSA
jgi:2,5-diamino-6-(ribosylamino)-4(3H)-pyrimidinone 5'-phosphate reductase